MTENLEQKIDVLRQLAVETKKYSRLFKYLPQYNIDGRSLEKYMFQLERELAAMIMQLEKEKNTSLAKKG